jgi:hypothetical protein
MKNLMKKIATSLGLTLMVASLVAISPNQAQAKVKKKAGNSAKAKSQAKRPGARNGSGSNAKVSTQDVHFSRARVNSQAISSGSNAKDDSLSDTMVTGATVNPRAKRRKTGIGNGGAVYDIRNSKP